MGWLEPTHLMFVLVGGSITAALWLHVAAVARERRRRARRFFVLGFSLGWTAARIVGGRRPRGLSAIPHQLGKLTKSSTAIIRTR